MDGSKPPEDDDHSGELHPSSSARGKEEASLEPLRRSGALAPQKQKLPLWVRRLNSETAPAVVDALVQTIKESTDTPAKTVRFSLGVLIGLMLSAAVAIPLSFLYPLTAPMAFIFFSLPFSVVLGIVASRGFRNVFTSPERKQIERAWAIYRLRLKALDSREADMQRNGITGPEIEDKLGHLRSQALEAFQGSLARLDSNGSDESTPDLNSDQWP